MKRKFKVGIYGCGEEGHEFGLYERRGYRE